MLGGGREGGLLYAMRVTTNSNAQCTTRGGEGADVCWSGRSWYTELLLGTTFLVTATHAKNGGRGVEKVVQMLSRLSGSTLFFLGFFLEECCSCRVVGKGGNVGLRGMEQGFDFHSTFRINQNSHRAFAVGDGGVLVPLLVNVPPLTKDPLSLKYQHVDHR